MVGRDGDARVSIIDARSFALATRGVALDALGAPIVYASHTRNQIGSGMGVTFAVLQIVAALSQRLPGMQLASPRSRAAAALLQIRQFARAAVVIGRDVGERRFRHLDDLFS